MKTDRRANLKQLYEAACKESGQEKTKNKNHQLSYLRGWYSVVPLEDEK